MSWWAKFGGFGKLLAGRRLLTVIVPTRNRPVQCAALLRFFRECELPYRILVADSSDEPQAIRNACRRIAAYRYFDPATPVIDKWAQVVDAIKTPYVVMTPDDDITFPHAIAAALDALIKNPDYVAAHGYVLRFGIYNSSIDIHGVFSFTPTISDNDPIRRLYYLMQRYQPFIWAVFRTPVFTAALQEASKVEGTIFQEVAFMNMAVLEGKVMRLPHVYAMRGSDESLTQSPEVDPFRWYLDDAAKFFARYSAYRNTLAQTINAMNISVPENGRIEQLLDMVHGTWLGRAVDVGQINHTARQLLGDDLPPIYIGPEWAGWRAIGPADVVHKSAARQRDYIWREPVAAAQPRDEIAISAAEMDLVESQLDFYR